MLEEGDAKLLRACVGSRVAYRWVCASCPQYSGFEQVWGGGERLRVESGPRREPRRMRREVLSNDGCICYALICYALICYALICYGRIPKRRTFIGEAGAARQVEL